MLPRNSSWLRSVFPIVMALLVLAIFAPLAPAQDLNLEGLAALEASPLSAPAIDYQRSTINAPLDLSALDRLAAPLSAAHGLQLSGLQELEHVAPKPQPAAQLVLPAATRPPAAVPATTAPAGVVCVNGQCYRTSPPMRQRGRLFRIR